MRTLVLNATYEPVEFIEWQRAIVLLMTEKADLVAEYSGKQVRSISKRFPLPSIVRLRKFASGAIRARFVYFSRKNVIIRDKMICQYCGVKCSNANCTIDHVLPRSRGGKDSWENNVTACSRCNTRKKNNTPEEAGMSLLRQPSRPHWRDLLPEKGVLESLDVLGLT